MFYTSALHVLYLVHALYIEAVVIPEEQLCLLCDNPIAVKFEPCGHAVLCEICSERAKKCPKCKVCTGVYLRAV